MKDTTDRLQYLLDRNITKRAETYVEWNNPNKAITEIQSTLTDMIFKKSQIEKEKETAQKKYIKKMNVGLRRCFLKRFHFPMMLARGEFICFDLKSKIKVFYYENQPFAMVKKCIDINSDGNTFNAIISSCVEPIFNDVLLREYLKAQMD